MKLISKLLRASTSRSRLVAEDMKRLNDVQRGLADKAADYILEGTNETVLSTLANSCAGNELEVCRTYLVPDSPTWRRRQLLAQQNPYDFEFAKRYADVLSAVCKDLPDGAVGSAKAPKLVRLFFSEAFDGVKEDSNRWPPKPAKIGVKGLSLEPAITMTEILGGTMVDLIDVLFGGSDQYGAISADPYREVVNIRPLAEHYPEQFIEAGSRSQALSRAQMIHDLHAFGLASTPSYIDFAVGLAGDSAKVVREIASAVLSGFDSTVLEPKAVELLGKGNVAVRAGMVDVLAKIGTQSALDALVAHQENEKTARIVAAIDTAMTVAGQSKAENTSTDDDTQYQAIDGSSVAIPQLQPLPDGASPKYGEEDRQALLKAIKGENERVDKANEEGKRKGYKYRLPQVSERFASKALSLFNAGAPTSSKIDFDLKAFLSWGAGKSWVRSALVKMPQKQSLVFAAAISNSPTSALSGYTRDPFADLTRDFLSGPSGDMRHLEAIEAEVGTLIRFYYSNDDKERKVEPGDILKYAIQDSYSYMETQFDNVPSEALWPYLAQNLNIIDEAFGLRPPSGVKLSRIGALLVLSRLPKPPARYFGQLLEAATGETKGGRAEARAMLADAPDVDQRVTRLLDDSRQAVRAGAAEWIAERDQKEAIPNLKARLKKEKSELAKAAILTALDILGEDLSGMVGPQVLLKEALAGLKKAKLDKLDWMALDHLPAVHYRSGDRVPDEVLRWWIFLAVKLKQPGGNALFDIYLERLDPESADQFSTWVLDSWYSYDTTRPAEQEGNAYAAKLAAGRFKGMVKWYKDYTEEQAYRDLKREFMSAYLNSGAATKGLLALAKHTPSAVAADRVRAYLKNHGSRTSQASALLELLAAMADPVTLQVVISAATRLKQKGVQKFAGTLVEKVAEAKSWSLDELGDRTVPSAGLDEDGVLQLPCGPEEKAYLATVGDSLVLEIRNPDGKVVKSLPSGQDDATKDSKKQLTASRRELKQVVTMQSARLYEALCSERSWPIEDWQRDIGEHPVVRKLAERAVWIGLDSDEQIAGAFRPTAEGDYTDAQDQDVDINAFAAVRLAHGALIVEADAKAWEGHLKDYEVTPLLTQFGRTLLSVEDGDEAQTTIEDRKGWVTDTFTVRGAATKLGYERGEAMDGGYFNEYIKSFQSAGVLAVIEFSGNCLPEENAPAAVISLSFERYSSGQRNGGTLKLSDVPPVLVSECWNDYRQLAAKAAFDENWEQKMPWM